MKRYSQMEPEELKKTIDELKTNLTKAKTDQLISETEMLKQKIHLAESYLIDPKTIAVGKYYTMEGYTNLFHVDYLNGIYAWGTFEGKSEKEAFPLSLLHRNH